MWSQRLRGPATGTEQCNQPKYEHCNGDHGDGNYSGKSHPRGHAVHRTPVAAASAPGRRLAARGSVPESASAHTEVRSWGVIPSPDLESESYFIGLEKGLSRVAPARANDRDRDLPVSMF